MILEALLVVEVVVVEVEVFLQIQELLEVDFYQYYYHQPLLEQVVVQWV
jgi:hypothetical protein